MTEKRQRPSLDDFRAFFGPDTYTSVMTADRRVSEGTELDTKNPKHRLIVASRSLFEEAIGEAMSELALTGAAGDLDLSSETGRADFLHAIKAGGALALVELGDSEQNADFFIALEGEG
jgi:hypothetical protein